MLSWLASLPLWASVLLQVAYFSFVILVVYKYLKEKVLYKYNPDKWILLSIAGLSFLLPIALNTYYHINLQGTIWQYLDSTVLIVFFLWFVDLRAGTAGTQSRHNKNTRNNKNNIVIRPKPKKNRAKK